MTRHQAAPLLDKAGEDADLQQEAPLLDEAGEDADRKQEAPLLNEAGEDADRQQQRGGHHHHSEARRDVVHVKILNILHVRAVHEDCDDQEHACKHG